MVEPLDYDVTVNGTRLHVRLEGLTSGPVVVLVNSLATDLAMWEPQIPALSARYRVLRYDARGHGRSAAPPGPYSMDMLVDDLLGLLAHIQAERAHVVGISLGGLTAMATALRKPPNVASIAACDCRADMPPEFVTGIEERNRLVRAQGMGAIADAMVQRWFTPATLAAQPDYLARIRQMVATTPVEGFTGCAEAIKTSGLRPRIRDIRLPALFVVGTQDLALPVAMMQAMADEVPGAQFTAIEGAGHLANVEQPATFNAALLGFLDRQG